MGFSDLKARYASSESVVINDIPRGTASIVCRTAFGVSQVAHLLEGASDLLRATGGHTCHRGLVLRWRISLHGRAVLRLDGAVFRTVATTG